MPDSKPTYHLVSHTHWDPEWYLTFQQYRIRLVRLMDRLLEILDRNPQYGPFMLDGQTHIVTSYLQVRPEQEDKIAAYVRSGRLLIGPWYLMPELFMLSGECHVRNLLCGRRIAQRFGGAMNVGYLCDTPGFISQLAQILRGFGIDSACGWRGIIGGEDTDQTPFWLESPDGSRVLMVLLPWAYGTVSDLGLDPERAPEILAEVERSELPFSATGDLVLMDGSDHREPFEGVVEAVRQINRRRDDVRVVQSSLPRYVADVLARRPQLKTHRGELRATANSYIFASGILATRMNIKQANFRCQAELENWAEPFWALRWALGAEHPTGLLQEAWRLLLDNAFHDVIYGGHVDGVTADAVNRYKQCFEIADWLGRQAVHEIAQTVTPGAGESRLVLFNPTNWAWRGAVDVELRFDLVAENRPQTYLIDEQHRAERTLPHLLPKLRDFIIVDEAGNEVVHQVNGRQVVLLNEDESGRGVHRTGRSFVEQVRISLDAAEIPALGYKRLSILPASEGQAFKRARGRMNQELHIPAAQAGQSEWRSSDLSGHICFRAESDLRLDPSGTSCENSMLKVAVNPDGTLDVYCKSSKSRYRGLHVFEDRGDVGDHYFFHPPDSDRLITSSSGHAAVSVTRNGPVEIEFRIDLVLDLPVSATAEQTGRSDQSIPCDIQTYVSIRADSPRIDFRTVVNNRSRDHRLRVLFGTDIPGSTCHADSVFDVVERPRLPEFQSHWREKLLGYFPQSCFLDISDGKRGVAFFNRGLPQYQVHPDGTYCLTLFRAVSHLGKYHLPEYGGHASSAVNACFPTPSAQMPGSSTYRYAAFFHSGDWQAGKVWLHARQYCFPPRGMHLSAQPGASPALPPALSFLRIEPDTCVLSAVKQSERGDGLIVRFYNVTPHKVRAKVTTWREFGRVVRTNLAEDEDLERIETVGRSSSLDVAGHQIVTLRFDGMDSVRQKPG